MKNNALVILIILLLVSAAGNYIQWKNANEEQLKRLLDNGRAQVEIANKQAEILSRDSAILKLKGKVAARKAQDSVAMAGLKQANFRLAKKINELRPLIAPDLAENDTLNAFVMLQDSLLAGKDSLIYSQEIFCQLQVRDLQDIIRLQEQKYHAQAEISEAWRQQAVESQAEAKKERRGKKFWQWTAGGITAIALYLAVK